MLQLLFIKWEVAAWQKVGAGTGNLIIPEKTDGFYPENPNVVFLSIVLALKVCSPDADRLQSLHTMQTHVVAGRVALPDHASPKLKISFEACELLMARLVREATDEAGLI
eukprot:COSAG02_NODE_4427_length_5372_cov_4.047791_5_plen_110_part_00